MFTLPFFVYIFCILHYFLLTVCFQFCASASDKPGKVTVTVNSSTGRLLGKTDFSYYDRDKGTLLRLVEDPKLQSEFVCHWADFKVKMKRSEGQDLSEPLAGTFL